MTEKLCVVDGKKEKKEVCMKTFFSFLLLNHPPFLDASGGGVVLVKRICGHTKSFHGICRDHFA